MSHVAPQAPSSQQEFDFLIPVSRPLLRIDEVRSILRLEKTAVYELVDAGRLEAHQDGPGTVYRITRRSLVAYLCSTALYEPTDYADIVAGLVRSMTPATRARFRNLTSNL